MAQSGTDNDASLIDFYPYRSRFKTYHRLDPEPRSRASILEELAAMAVEEDRIAHAGRVSGSIYHGDHDHYRFLTVVAAAWAALISLGERGYLEIADAIFKTAAAIRDGVRAIPELELFGDPTFVVAFRSPSLDIFHVNDFLVERGWRLNGLHLPPGLHFCITRPNTAPGVAEAFLADLKDAVEYAKHPPATSPRSGALYGIGGTPAGNDALNMMFAAALDAMYDVAPTG